MVGEVLQSQDRNISLLISDSPGPSRVMPGDALFSEVLKQRKGDSVFVWGKEYQTLTFVRGSRKYNLNCSFNSRLDNMACISYSYLLPFTTTQHLYLTTDGYSIHLKGPVDTISKDYVNNSNSTIVSPSISKPNLKKQEQKQI